MSSESPNFEKTSEEKEKKEEGFQPLSDEELEELEGMALGGNPERDEVLLNKWDRMNKEERRVYSEKFWRLETRRQEEIRRLRPLPPREVGDWEKFEEEAKKWQSLSEDEQKERIKRLAKLGRLDYPGVKPFEEKEVRRVSKADIYQTYWSLEAEQQQLEEKIRDEKKALGGMARGQGLKIENLERASIDPQLRYLAETKKTRIRELFSYFNESDPVAIGEIIEQRKEYLERNLKRHQATEERNAASMIMANQIKSQMEVIEKIIGEFNGGNNRPLYNLLEGDFRVILEKNLRGEEGFKWLQKAVLLKEALNALERDIKLTKP